MDNYIKVVLVVFIIQLSSNGFSQVLHEYDIVLSDTFCFSNKKPLPFLAGSRIQLKCDTAYIINKHRFVLYEKAATVIREGKYVNACNVVIKNLEDRIDAQNKAFTQLYNNYIKLDSVSQTTIKETRTSLVQVNNTLVNAQDKIVVVDKKMDELKDTINKQRRQSFMDKMLFGTGGIAVGILVGLIISL